MQKRLTDPPDQRIFIVYTQRSSMITKIQKWGNSLGLRIPKSFAEEVGVEEGSPVNISLEGNRLVVRPLRGKRYLLSHLLSQVKEENLHKEISTGDAAGKEIW